MLVLFLYVLMTSLVLNAAELGGDCCADLEERVQELEKALSPEKGSDLGEGKSKTIRMQLIMKDVNPALLQWQDGSGTAPEAEGPPVTITTDIEKTLKCSNGHVVEIGVLGNNQTGVKCGDKVIPTNRRLNGGDPKTKPGDKKPDSKTQSKSDPKADKKSNTPTAKAQRKLIDPTKLAAAAPLQAKKHYNGASRSCTYSKGSSLQSAFSKKVQKCKQAYQKAQSSCDGSANSKIQQALKSVSGAANQFAKMKNSSGIAACDEYGRNASNLENALDNFQEKCIPQKAECEALCISAAESSLSIYKEVQNDMLCVAHIPDIAKELRTQGSSATDLVKKCSQFKKPLDQSAHDARELFGNRAVSSSCKNHFSEVCARDPKSGACNANRLSKLENPDALLKTAGSEDQPSSELENLRKLNESNNGSFMNVGKSTAFASLNNKEGERAAGPTGVSGKGSKLDPSSSVNRSRGFGSGRSSYSRRKRRRKTKYKFGSADSSSSGGAAIGAQSAKAEGNSQLERFLPGGNNDPKVYGADGITGPNGPSIFQKVNRRYELYLPKLRK